MEASAKFSSTLDTPLVGPFAVSKNPSNPFGVVYSPRNGHGASRGDSNQTVWSKTSLIHNLVASMEMEKENKQNFAQPISFSYGPRSFSGDPYGNSDRSSSFNNIPAPNSEISNQRADMHTWLALGFTTSMMEGVQYSSTSEAFEPDVLSLDIFRPSQGFDSEVPTVSKEVQAEKRIDEDRCANSVHDFESIPFFPGQETVGHTQDPQQHFQPIIRRRVEALPALSAVHVPEPVTFPHSPERGIPKYPQNLKHHFQPGMCFVDRPTDSATCRSQDTRGVAEVYFQDHSSGVYPTAHGSQHVAAVNQLNTLQPPIHFQCAQPPMQSESISFRSDSVTAPCYPIDHLDPARALLLAMLRL
ncbi:hypothetical protein DFH05DRAFT_1523609 [Lentinula detonsa]|uniref:Uncharacterized protein n=1 Tax=Lentinula detonsa TaxID=2804962 RepID=A0A9W8P1T4_9AGAR|nr:hypothetical protein DFH05DRAFT_1523609 [Lentinula detonsa]